ncbi:hypothetical protein TI39_contig4206g00004 [Zymoseptoria brevis]|uniref:Uncharacterized protein n=1 Tax=Zymoseptoria brevis TaxID=1047168 RepID=A0A0F4GB44_9PEZI|nr:hypothetical protein TI39_contig4206g00004 [Zymoseptoria brevis]
MEHQEEDEEKADGDKSKKELKESERASETWVTTMADGLQRLPQELYDEVYGLVVSDVPRASKVKIDNTYEPPMALQITSKSRKQAFQVYTSFQSTSSPCPSPRATGSRHDSLQPDSASQQPAPISNPKHHPKHTSKPLPPPNHLPRKKKKTPKTFDHAQQLKLLRQHLLARCPILSQSSNRIHAIVSWGGNISSTLALRPAFEVQRTFLEDTFPGVYAKEDMYDRLRKGKKKAREGPPPESEWGFGVDPHEGVDRGRLEWRMDDVFHFEGFYADGDREREVRCDG